MEETYLELSVQLLWSVMLVLVILTLVLFVTSIVARFRHRQHDLKVKALTDKFYPVILRYLSDELTEEEVEDYFSGQGLEYSVFEDIVFGMLESLEGEEAYKLQELLFLSPIFQHHLDQLNSSNDVSRIKACTYFSYLRLINYRVIKRLLDFLDSDNKLLVFSAASALMASRETDIRAHALYMVVKKKHYSGMAMLEMVYKFHNEEDEQMDEEAEVLRALIGNKNIPIDNAGVLIEAASELGYQQLMPYFYEKLQSTRRRWRKPIVLKALIKAQGVYFNLEATEEIKNHIAHKDPQVREMVAFTLGQFGGEEHLKSLYEMLFDPVYEVKYMAIKMLYENGEEGIKFLEQSFEVPQLNTLLILKTLQQ
ncbi:MAG: HEAT repeat domain-containing protein [Balneolaceae bacterium]|nr:HEAT repeat domain-containing protein [Balneolaceae bacterium]